MKILSIIVPIYNTKEYLGRCLDSMLDNRINNEIEIICVNDSSKDNSLIVIEAYNKKYPETVQCINKENGGHGSTINVGIERATGAYFKVVDSDDLVNKENFVKLVHELKILVKRDVDLVISAYSRDRVDTGKQTIVKYNFPEKEIISFLYGNHLLNKAEILNYEKYFTMAASTYRTKLLKDSSMRLTEKSPYVDMEYNVFFAKNVWNIYYLDNPIYRYCIGREGQSVARLNLVKNYRFHENILKRLINFYLEINYDNIVYKKYVRRILLYMINTNYMIQGFFREGKNQKKGNELIKNFDVYLNGKSKDLYDAVNFRSYIKRGRKHNFKSFYFNMLQYALCRNKDIRLKKWERLEMKKDYDIIIGGAGYAGSIMARKYAEAGRKVLLVDRRNHIGGNMYDYKSDSGILIHKYGPHIAYMETDKAFNFLSEFTEWNQYEHCVNIKILGKEIPLPFNLTGIDILFDEKKAKRLKNILIKTYGMNTKVPILDMLDSDNKDLNDLAQFIYNNVFVNYTIKMWGLDPKKISPAVTKRIPVRISYDDRHFTSRIQVMPKNGYARIFENMLNHENIDLLLDKDVKDIVTLDVKNQKLFYNNKEFKGVYIYTGALDELLDYKFGKISYRSLEFKIENHNVDRIQQTGTLNWPDKRPETRRSEMKIITSQENIKDVTVTLTEYPRQYNKNADKWNEPYYPIPSDENEKNYQQYYAEVSKINNIILIGRLAEYKYYNMEAIILKSLKLFESMVR